MTESSSSSEFSYDIYNDIDGQVDAAYAQNVETGTTPPSSNEVIQTAINALPSPDLQPLTGHTHEFQVTAETSLLASRELFNLVGLYTPELSEFESAGFDFAKLGAAYGTMVKMGLEPELVFAPNNLALFAWEDLYRNLQDDATINADGRIRVGGL